MHISEIIYVFSDIFLKIGTNIYLCEPKELVNV